MLLTRSNSPEPPTDGVDPERAALVDLLVRVGHRLEAISSGSAGCSIVVRVVVVLDRKGRERR